MIIIIILIIINIIIFIFLLPTFLPLGGKATEPTIFLKYAHFPSQFENLVFARRINGKIFIQIFADGNNFASS